MHASATGTPIHKLQTRSQLAKHFVRSPAGVSRVTQLQFIPAGLFIARRTYVGSRAQDQ